MTSISDRNKMFLELIEHFKLQECPQIVIFLKLFHKRLSFIIDEESLKVRLILIAYIELKYTCFTPYS